MKIIADSKGDGDMNVIKIIMNRNGTSAIYTNSDMKAADLPKAISFLCNFARLLGVSDEEIKKACVEIKGWR